MSQPLKKLCLLVVVYWVAVSLLSLRVRRDFLRDAVF